MSDTTALYKEADRLKNDGQLEDAVSKLNQLLQVDANHTLAHLALAVIYGRLGQHEQAVGHGQKACEIDPNDPFHFTAMSVTYQRAWQGTQKQEFIQLAEEAMARAHALEGR